MPQRRGLLLRGVGGGWVNKKSSLSHEGSASKSGIAGHNNIPVCQRVGTFLMLL